MSRGPGITLVGSLDRASCVPEGGFPQMVPLLLWILGVPGLIIILLLLFGVVHL